MKTEKFIRMVLPIAIVGFITAITFVVFLITKNPSFDTKAYWLLGQTAFLSAFAYFDIRANLSIEDDTELDYENEFERIFPKGIKRKN